MQSWMQFLASIAHVLWDLFEYVEKGEEDPELEKQIAMNIIRASKDAQMKRELGVQ